MAGINTIDIMGSLDAALSAITGSKVDLSLPETTPFAKTKKQMDDNQAIMDKMAALQKESVEKRRLRAVAVQQVASGGVGTNIRAPARIRNRI